MDKTILSHAGENRWLNWPAQLISRRRIFMHTASEQNTAESYLVAAFYRFVSLPDFRDVRPALQQLCEDLDLLGSMLCFTWANFCAAAMGGLGWVSFMVLKLDHSQTL